MIGFLHVFFYFLLCSALLRFIQMKTAGSALGGAFAFLH